MIIGRGLLANSLSKIDRDSYLFYVNGISNSVLNEIPENNFEYREILRLAENIGDRVFVYISTIQVNMKINYERPYVRHKYQIESLIKKLFSNYLIVRTSNLVGNNQWNKHTLFNYLHHSLITGKVLYVEESVVRNILDVEHFIELFECYLKYSFQRNQVINIVNPRSYKMADILNGFEYVFEIKFKKQPLAESVAHFRAPKSLSLSLANKCNINFEDYLNSVIKKYYANKID
jgi:nucleoside-diphosphate-sugar epimerase